MKRLVFRFLALALCLMLPAGSVLAADMGMGMPPGGMSPDMMGPPPDGGPGGGGGGDAAPAAAAIVIVDGAEDPDSEYEPGEYSGLIQPQDGALSINGLELGSGDYAFNGLSISGPDSVVRLQKANIRLSVDTPVTDADTGGSAANIDNGATLYISDSNLIVDGAARYVTANYNDATLVVNSSLIQSTGSTENTAAVSEPFSNEALLISGTARANFSVGATKTYYFNSTCVAEGWAALSTDSATGSGLDLYAYNTDGIAENGGYSTYADTNCRVWLYGSRLTAAEIGCIISKSGKIYAYPAAAADSGLLRYNEGGETEADTSVIGGRNAVMIHAPDMMGQGIYAADCGTFIAEDAYIGTSQELHSTKDYSDYSEAVGAYIDYVSGSDILIRSTSANIELKNVEMESYNNTLIHTVLNADSMGNFLAPGDGDQVEPVAVTLTDMDVTGDIRHEDYQRRMTVELLGDTTLSGDIVSGTMESWNETWKDYGQVNWVVDDSFDATYGVSLVMSDSSVWNVTGQSSLTSLRLGPEAVVNGEITLNGEPLVPEPGVTYEGEIFVTGDYVAEPEAPEESAEPETEEAVIPEAAAETAEPAAVEPEALQAEPDDPAAAEPAETSASTEKTSHKGVIAAVLVVLAAAAVCVPVIRKRKK